MNAAEKMRGDLISIGTYILEQHTEIDRLKTNQAKAREWIWLNHGCPISVLYGDDGEMQCSCNKHRSIDFKRMPITQIIEILRESTS